MARRMIALTCLTAFLTTACHTYRLADEGEAVPGSSVRVRVTPEEAGRLMETVQVQGRQLEGRVIEALGDDGLMIEAGLPGSNPKLYQRLDVPRSEIVEIELQEFSAAKTVLLIGAVAAAAAAIGFTAVASDRNDPEVGPPPPPDNIRIPLFRFGTR